MWLIIILGYFLYFSQFISNVESFAHNKKQHLIWESKGQREVGKGYHIHERGSRPGYQYFLPIWGMHLIWLTMEYMVYSLTYIDYR